MVSQPTNDCVSAPRLRPIRPGHPSGPAGPSSRAIQAFRPGHPPGPSGPAWPSKQSELPCQSDGPILELGELRWEAKRRAEGRQSEVRSQMEVLHWLIACRAGRRVSETDGRACFKSSPRSWHSDAPRPRAAFLKVSFHFLFFVRLPSPFFLLFPFRKFSSARFLAQSFSRLLSTLSALRGRNRPQGYPGRPLRFSPKHDGGQRALRTRSSNMVAAACRRRLTKGLWASTS